MLSRSFHEGQEFLGLLLHESSVPPGLHIDSEQRLCVGGPDVRPPILEFQRDPIRLINTECSSAKLRLQRFQHSVSIRDLQVNLTASGKGRPSIPYQIPDSCSFLLLDWLPEARGSSRCRSRRTCGSSSEQTPLLQRRRLRDAFAPS